MRTLISTLCFFLLLSSHAQTGTVTGSVSDSTDATPIPGVSIAVDNGAATTTDLDGLFRLEVAVGRHAFLFRAIGYQDHRDTIEVQPNFSNLLQVKLEPATAQLNAVVVSAGKFEQRVGEVTQSLSVLPASLVRDRNTSSLDKALAQVPGVVVIDNDPQIRGGSGFSYGAGSRVMMLVDDLPILSGDIGRPSWTFLPIENLEQVEVVKGASSVLYGSAALSGTINIRTAYPRSTPRTRATVFGGVYDTPGNADAKWWGDNPPLITGANFFHSQQFGNFDLVIGGNAYSDEGYVGPERIKPDTLATDPLRTSAGGYENRVRFNIATRWRNKKVKGLNYGINGNVMKSRSTSVFIWDDIDAGLYRPEPGTVTRTRGTQYYVDPFINYVSASGFKQSLRLRYYRQDFDNDNDQSNSNDMLYGQYQVQRRVDLFGETTITAGLVGQRTVSDSQLYQGNSEGNGRNDATNEAAFLQVDKKLFDRLMLNAGVRYENMRVNDEEQSATVFRGGATYQLFEATYLRASYGQGFRFPTIGERYIRTAVGVLNIYPNPDLRPERSYNAEVGLKQGFKVGGFQGYVDLTAFQQEYEDYVEFTFGVWAQPSLTNFGGLGFRSVNTGGARITGTEAEVTGTGKLGNVRIDLLMGYTYTLPVSTTPHEVYATPQATGVVAPPINYVNTSYDTTDNILKFRVQHLFRGDVRLGWKRFSGGVSVRYNSHVRNIDRIFVDLDQQPPYLLPTGAGEWMRTHTSGDWILDLRVGFALTENLKAIFLVNNATNEVYAIRPMAIEAPRSYQVQLALDL